MTATEQAMQDLRAAIRAELIAEAVEALQAAITSAHETECDVNYIDGLADAIVTVEQLTR